MLEFKNGNMFRINAHILVNTVNCFGVMGGGIALEFKNKYPKMYKDYYHDCLLGNYKPGEPVAWTDDKVIIINFPTKNHYRNPSELKWIETGLIWLKEFLKDKNDLVVALPALGCGLGGLKWENVKPLIEQYLHDSPANIHSFLPEDSWRFN
jgi:O-acetyl-ADP-ribose deacetylase (regulator of RNase III)